jgi:hypothetical protein
MDNIFSVLAVLQCNLLRSKAMEDKQAIIRNIVAGMRDAIIFTFPEDEHMETPVSGTPFTDESEKILFRAATAFYDTIPDDLLALMKPMGFISVGIDFWFSCSGSGVSFDDRKELEEYENMGEFLKTIREKFGQLEHAEVWYDVTNNEMNFHVYRPKF